MSKPKFKFDPFGIVLSVFSGIAVAIIFYQATWACLALAFFIWMDVSTKPKKRGKTNGK